MIFANQFTGTNQDIPNMALAYAATVADSMVVDYNTRPGPKRHVGPTVTSGRIPRGIMLKSCIDVQCCYRFASDTQVYEDQTPFTDLPFPEYERFDSFPIFLKNWQSGKWHYPLMTSIGCPYGCIYCAARKRKWIPRSDESCVSELEHAKQKYKIKSFNIMDDCFNYHVMRPIWFSEALLNSTIDLEWMCTNGLRADKLQKEEAYYMAKSGCSTVGFGIESSDPAVLKTIKKGETIEQIEFTVKIAKTYFKSVSGFFITGLPGASLDSDWETLHWGHNLGIYQHYSHFNYGETFEDVPPEYQKIHNEAISMKRPWNRLMLSTPLLLKYLKMDAKKIWNRIKR